MNSNDGYERALAAKVGTSAELPEGKTALAVREYNEALRAASGPVFEPESEPPVCFKHDWRPVRRGPQPRPRASMCPSCIQEADHVERKPRPVIEQRELPEPENVKRTPAMDRVWEQHRQAQAAAGVLIAGSEEEEAAVLQADEEHAQVLERDHPRMAPAVSQRIEGGQVVTFHGGEKLRAAWRRRSRTGSFPSAPRWPGGS